MGVMRLLLLVSVSVVMLYGAQGTSVFNRNGGLLRAFTGANPENTDRDTDGLFTIIFFALLFLIN